MVESRLGSFKRIFMAAMLVAVMLVVAAPAAPKASAARSICRTDPIVTLSNGQVITMWSEIYTDLEDVTEVEYHLHAPRGLTVVSVVHPDPATAHLEKFYFYADQLPLVYQTNVIVHTSLEKPVKVRAWTEITLLGKLIGASIPRTGMSEQELRLLLVLV